MRPRSDAAQDAPDLRERAQPSTLPEWMDEPCEYPEWLGAVRDLEQINRLLRGYTPTLRFLQTAASRQGGPQVLRVLDIGYGGGGLLRSAALWAQRAGIAVQLTGLDLNPYAARAATELTAAACRRVLPAERLALTAIRFRTGDALASGEQPDVVVSSLLMHHLDDAELLNLLRWMERHARMGWHINDLERSSKAMRGFRMLAWLLRWSPMVRHDGPVSFRRAFTRADWHRLLEKSSIQKYLHPHMRIHTDSEGDAPVSVQGWWPGRLCVTRWM